MNRLIALLSLLLLAGSLSLTALAQSEQTQSAQAAEQATSPQGDRAVIGQVVEVRDVQLKGVEGEHRLLKLQNRSGKTLLVSLGSLADAKEAVSFEKGDRVIIIGRAARISDTPVLYARYAGKLYGVGHMSKAVAD